MNEPEYHFKAAVYKVNVRTHLSRGATPQSSSPAGSWPKYRCDTSELSREPTPAIDFSYLAQGSSSLFLKQSVGCGLSLGVKYIFPCCSTGP